MHILVLQHADVEHPGIFRNFLREDGHTWDTVELNNGAELPDLKGYDALWALGGPMDVWQEDAHPWLRAEKDFIRDAVQEPGGSSGRRCRAVPDTGDRRHGRAIDRSGRDGCSL